MKIVKEFFEKHPGVDQVYESLGVLFIEKDRAEEFLKGTEGQKIIVHDREFLISTPADADAADREIKEAIEKDQSIHVLSTDGIPAHDHSQNVKTIIQNDATTYGKSAEEVEAIENEQAKAKQAPKKQGTKPTKESAKGGSKAAKS